MIIKATIENMDCIVISFSQSVTEHDRSMELFFSGLYSYHVPTNTWTKLRDDCPQLRSRIGHSMLFHAVSI